MQPSVGVLNLPGWVQQLRQQCRCRAQIAHPLHVCAARYRTVPYPPVGAANTGRCVATPILPSDLQAPPSRVRVSMTGSRPIKGVPVLSAARQKRSSSRLGAITK
eukprot:360618-Chlamydomonas_euryale.AAC.4